MEQTQADRDLNTAKKKLKEAREAETETRKRANSNEGSALEELRQREKNTQEAMREKAAALDRKNAADAAAAALEGATGEPIEKKKPDQSGGDHRGSRSNPVQADDETSTGVGGNIITGRQKGNWALQPYLLAVPVVLLAIATIGWKAGTDGRVHTVSPRPATVFSHPASPAPHWVVTAPPPVREQASASKDIQEEEVHISYDRSSTSAYSDYLPQFTGPSDPERFVMMVVALASAGIPYLVDLYRGDRSGEIRQAAEYRGTFIHFIILGAGLLLFLWEADQEFGVSAGYGRPAVTLARNVVQSHIQPLVANTVETAESPVWEAEDLLFDDGKHLLSIVIAGATGGGLGFFLEPPAYKRQEGYSSRLMQGLSVTVAAVLASLLGNA